MFIYTRATLDKIVSDLKRSVDISNIVGQLVYVLYLIYAIFAPVGFVYLNAFLLIASLVYFVIYIVYYKKNDKLSKDVKATARHTFKWIKLSSKALTLAITLYGVYSMTNHLTAFSIILTTLTIIVWILNLSIELITIAVEHYTAMLKEALAADVGELARPVQAVSSVVKKIVGINTPDTDSSREPSSRLKSLVGKFKEKKAKQKKEKEALREQKKKEQESVKEQKNQPKSSSEKQTSENGAAST
jgi:hypothetical protein